MTVEHIAEWMQLEADLNIRTIVGKDDGPSVFCDIRLGHAGDRRKMLQT